MRIGVFGGSFDPPHSAHAALARAAREHLGLDLVLWLPTFNPPHKGSPATSFQDRLDMTRALTTRESGTEVSDLESTLPSPSYTLHTLQALRKSFGEHHTWHLIIGADNWAGFSKWHEPGAVLKAAALAVYPRAGFSVTDLPEGSVLLNFPQMPEQSTDFRAWLARDRAAALAALPQAVADIIRDRNLYQAASPV
jgi:nicotinate-nucleotide adenylyltransferase